MTQDSSQLFEAALGWLKDNYRSFHFFQERDIVWTLQIHMLKEIETSNLPFKIYDNHKLARDKGVDLAILDRGNATDTVVEIKYEPDHKRGGLDISMGKLNPSRVYWNSPRDGGVEPDVHRINQIVRQRTARTSFSVFIDEGSYFSSRPAPEGAKWENWGRSPYSQALISVLRARFLSI